MTEPYWEPLAAGSQIPAVVNGQWIKGVGGAAVWASIRANDVIGLGATTSSSLSAANTDITWPIGQGAHTLFHEVNATGNAGSIRSYGYPLGQGGTRLVLRHNGSGSSSFAVLHNGSVTSPRVPLYLATGRDRTLLPGESIEFILDDSYGLWMEVGRGVVVPYGTTLPAAPADGSEAILVDNLANPSYQWRFRYNAQSSSAYKWEFVGGAPAYRGVEASETIAAGAALGDLATVGPTFVITRAGEYDLSISCRVDKGSGAGWTTATMYVPGPVPYLQAYASPYNTGVTPVPYTTASANTRAALTAGQTLTAIYGSQAADVAGQMLSYQRRRLMVVPVRVA